MLTKNFVAKQFSLYKLNRSEPANNALGCIAKTANA